MVSVQAFSVQGGLCPGWSLSRGGISVKGVSVQGSLCPGGLCPGVSVWGSLSGGSLSRVVEGSLSGRPPAVPLHVVGTHPTGMHSCFCLVRLIRREL